MESVWMAANCFVADTDMGHWCVSMRSAVRATELITDLRPGILDDAPISLRRRDLLARLALPDNFDILKPVAKSGALSACDAPDHLIAEFLDISARINILRSVQGSMRCGA